MQQFAILPEVDHYVFDLSTIDMLPNMTEVGARIAFERNNVNFSLRSSVQLSNILTQVDTEASVSFNISNYRLGVGATCFITIGMPYSEPQIVTGWVLT